MVVRYSSDMNTLIRIPAFIIFFLVLISHVSGTDFAKYGWESSEIEAANTSRDVDFLSQDEKEVILVMNLCRLFPNRFLALMEYMWQSECTNTYEFNIEINSSYYASLKKDLKNLAAMPALQPDGDLSKTAQAHASDMGKSGKIGHNSSRGKGFSERMKKYVNQYKMVGENCSYGYSKAVDIVMQLLVDHDVPSLGHRKNILNPEFLNAGLAIEPHLAYDFNCVIDYSN